MELRCYLHAPRKYRFKAMPDTPAKRSLVYTISLYVIGTPERATASGNGAIFPEGRSGLHTCLPRYEAAAAVPVYRQTTRAVGIILLLGK